MCGIEQRPAPKQPLRMLFYERGWDRTITNYYEICELSRHFGLITSVETDDIPFCEQVAAVYSAGCPNFSFLISRYHCKYRRIPEPSYELRKAWECLDTYFPGQFPGPRLETSCLLCWSPNSGTFDSRPKPFRCNCVWPNCSLLKSGYERMLQVAMQKCN